MMDYRQALIYRSRYIQRLVHKGKYLEYDHKRNTFVICRRALPEELKTK